MVSEQTIEIQVSREFLSELREKLASKFTSDEVVLVVPRPSGKILLHTKSFYPEGVYRLPSGHVHPGEAADAAFFREFLEEIGTDGAIDRKLAVLHDRLIAGEESMSFASHIYLAREIAVEPHPEDESEDISGYIEIEIEELPQIAENLRNLPGRWRDWGHFRAAAHDVVAERLKKGC